MRTQSPQSTSAATLLQLAWLASPALPVGGFSYSEGLESAVERGHVCDAEGVAAWLDDQLQLSLARNELPVVVRALDAWHTGQFEAVVSLNEWVHATRESAELRRQTQQMGRSLLAWLRLRLPENDDRLAALSALQPAPSWPVAFALAASDGGGGPREAGLAYAFGWAENMVQAAIKVVPLGQGAGQRVLGRLVAAIPDAVDRALDLPESERQAFAPMLAILSAQHETQYSRLFRS